MKSKKYVPTQFDVEALQSALDGERIARDLNWKDVSAESGVSASTLTRLSQGKRPDVDSLTALTHWLGLSADRFMRLPQKGFGGASPLARISSILRDDPNLNKDAATALDQLIKSTYARLRSQR
ncbi:MAG: helix-turn-helix transcriptional regulator [Bradyrhizobium sp.]|uniref:helix-turn-helix domain-containing protein n=1 Tax=Bradyrhizobium sp. TaxID=376 RepID=UPI003C7494B6